MVEYKAIADLCRTLAELCAALADPEHCLHTQTKRLSRASLEGLRDAARMAATQLDDATLLEVTR